MDLARFGRAVRALRFRRGWRQADVAQRADVSRAIVGRVERGERTGLSIDDIDRVAEALGATTDLRLSWQGEGLDRLLDEEHASLVDAVVRRLRVLGWDVAVEITFSRYGERGSIDVMAFHPARRALVVIEVKSVTPDMQAMIGGIDRKARLAPALALVRGWDAAVVARVLAIRDTRTNRRRLDEHRATLGAALPWGTRDVLRWLQDPAGDAVSGIWLLTDGQRVDGTRRRRHRVRLTRA